MIRNIVFDMGNVLVRFEPELFLTREGITKPEEREIILRELFRSIEWAQMDMGVLREETAEPRVLSRIPEPLHAAAQNLLYHWSRPEDVLEGMEELVSRLKAAGYGIWLLSNASLAHHIYWPKYSVSRYFDGVMVSADLRLIKPMNEIYERFTEQFHLKPEECVFIDDMPINAAGAVKHGWKGIVFHGDPEELKEKLREIGVEF